jgi:DnaK suppressor protein
VDDARSALVRSRGATIDRVADLRHELTAIAESTAASPDDEHDAEGATVGFERARVTALLAEAERALDEIERALARLDAGDYGWCEVCGDPIGDERLQALPTTTRCVRCSATARRRPGR